MDQSYNYVIGDFPTGLNVNQLDLDIRASDIVTGLRGISTEGNSVAITFKAALDPSDESILAGVVSNHDGAPWPEPTTKVDISQVSLNAANAAKLGVSVFPAEGSRTNIITHLWTDPTSWYQGSIRVTDEIPTPLDANGKNFQLANQNIIDLEHGKIFGEDFLLDSNGVSYRVVVKVDGVPRLQADMDTGDGEWSLNYRTGVLTMNPNVAPASLSVSYHYSTTSAFVIKPLPGKILKIKSAEVQFSRNVSMQDTVQFEYLGWCSVFDPVGFANGDYGPDPEFLIPLTTPTRYKTMHNFLSESNGSFPVIPASTDNSPHTQRDLRSDVLTFPWDYQASIPVYSSMGMQIRMSLLNDRPMRGDFATATFYCFSESP